jgi:hypothetical protein
MTEPTEETIDKTIEATELSKEEVLDGRTVVGKLQAKVQKLEEMQSEILKTLVEHGNKIADCSIRR